MPIPLITGATANCSDRLTSNTGTMRKTIPQATQYISNLWRQPVLLWSCWPITQCGGPLPCNLCCSLVPTRNGNVRVADQELPHSLAEWSEPRHLELHHEHSHTPPGCSPLKKGAAFNVDFAKSLWSLGRVVLNSFGWKRLSFLLRKVVTEMFSTIWCRPLICLLIASHV